MRIAVVGATGNIGARVVGVLERDGHEPVRISRSAGIDAYSGDGLDDALSGVAAVVDVTSTTSTDEPTIVDFFRTVTANVLGAEQRAGVRHHVALSIVGISAPAYNPHYAGKLAQEALIEAGTVPYSIVRATQFHDFAATVMSWTEQDGAALIAPLLVQPIAPDDVAEILVEIALGQPQGRYRDVAGPEPEDLVDMARRTCAARGRQVRLIPTWDGPFSTAMAGTVLLPGPDARLASTTFDAWLAAGAR